MDAELKNWDFGDQKLNATQQLKNRRKSALNLDMLEFDFEKQTAVFRDPEKNIIVKTSLTYCECRDFNFTGKMRRKKYQPCMHIYRLAIELGLIKADLFDSKMKKDFSHRRKNHTNFIRDVDQWGSWNIAIHETDVQLKRQYQAYTMLYDDPEAIIMDDGSRILGHYVTLESCSCPDFQERGLPCKHIYYLALVNNIDLSMSPEDFVQQKLIYDEEGIDGPRKF